MISNYNEIFNANEVIVLMQALMKHLDRVLGGLCRCLMQPA